MDYSKYDIDELNDVCRNIDRHKYPDRYQSARHFLDLKIAEQKQQSIEESEEFRAFLRNPKNNAQTKFTFTHSSFWSDFYVYLGLTVAMPFILYFILSEPDKEAFSTSPVLISMSGLLFPGILLYLYIVLHLNHWLRSRDTEIEFDFKSSRLNFRNRTSIVEIDLDDIESIEVLAPRRSAQIPWSHYSTAEVNATGLPSFQVSSCVISPGDFPVPSHRIHIRHRWFPLLKKNKSLTSSGRE